MQEGDEEIISREAIPGDPEQEECQTFVEYYIPEGELYRAVPYGRSSVALQGALKVVSPWEWSSAVQGDVISVKPASGQTLYFKTDSGSSIAKTTGISRSQNYQIQLQNSSGAAVLSGASPSRYVLADAQGRQLSFSADTGKMLSMKSSTGKLVTADAYSSKVKLNYNSSGAITSAYSAAKGAMNVKYGADGSVAMEWYGAKAVRELRSDGSYAVQGTPYRTVSYKAEKQADGTTVVRMTHQQAGLPVRTVVREMRGNNVSISKGGANGIVRSYTRTMEANGVVRTVETIKRAGRSTPAVSRSVVSMRTSGGWVKMSETSGYGSAQAKTTTFSYASGQYQPSCVAKADGSYTNYKYDSDGRVTQSSTLWANGKTKTVSTAYATGGFYNHKPAKVVETYEKANGEAVNMKVVTNTYETTGLVSRKVTKVQAAGSAQVLESIEERYGEDTPVYAAGKLKMTQSENGVQRVWEYEETSAYGAAYKSIETEKANGEIVAGQSHRREQYITAAGTVTREEEFIWDGSQWLKLSGATYEYDDQDRRIKTTRDNGRVSTTEWMCCGPLSETDENGIKTSYAYNEATQLIETTRSAVYVGDECVTPEIITEYERDADGRVLKETKYVGAMKTTVETEYDELGRITRRVDAMGNETLTGYCEDGLTTTVTQPNGATLITQEDTDGRVIYQGGTGQREKKYTYEVQGDGILTTELSGGVVLSRELTNGLGQVIEQETPTLHGFIKTYREYNTKGELVKEYKDAGNGSERPAPVLYEYDTFGNVTKQTLALTDSPNKTNSPIVEMVYGNVEVIDGGVYSVTKQTTYNAQGEALTSVNKKLISSLSDVLASKQIQIDVRGNTTSSWVEYGQGAVRTSYTKLPTSTVVAMEESVDDFVVKQTSSTDVTTHQKRQYKTDGIVLQQTDGRGNTTTDQSDLLGRTVHVTDAAGNSTTTVYEYANTQPSRLTDALGNTAYYQYDLRGRKIAEYGTGIQPATFGYDDADNLTKLTTYRAKGKVISTNPDGLDGDTTTWVYDLATGLELSITYANGKGAVNTYDAYNNLATQTNARGIVTTYSYDIKQGVLTGITFSDDTPAQHFTYNFLGKLTSVMDASGIRSISYDRYGNLNEESMQVGSLHYTTQEHWDAYGRSTGYVLQKNGNRACGVSQAYGTYGRIAVASFIHANVEHKFHYGYLPGSNLLQTLSMPNGVTLTQEYEEKRNLLTGMDYVRENSLVTQRRYTYDALARPETRDTRYPNKSVSYNDSFAYNHRSELTGALLDNSAYTYAYDNIGNREIAQESAEGITYAANELNQYTRISTDGENFTPEYDADGNQTLVQTSTGIWRVTYNAQNRAVMFESTDDSTIITCAYDYMGRRFEKQVIINGTLTDHQRFIYRNYLQIAAVNLKEDAPTPDLWFLIWDPTQTTATRPLAIRKDGVWYTYGWDLTKNICELYGQEGYIRTIYRYSPYGTVIAEGDVEQAIQWSSEMCDGELGLVYYNYRYYNPTDGRWTRRDPLGEITGLNFFDFVLNAPLYYVDLLGLYAFILCERIRPRRNALFFYKCHIYIYEPCSDKCCKKEIEAAEAAQNNKALSKALDQLRNCIAKNNGGGIKVTIKKGYYSNMRENEMSISPNDPYGRKGPLPVGMYRVLPRAESGKNYPKGTPAITGLNQNIPGRVRTPKGTDRSALLIHGAGRSEGCLSMECGAQNEIKRIMDQNISCGGTYLRIVGK